MSRSLSHTPISQFYVKLAGSMSPSTMKYSCGNFSHVVPWKGTATLQAGDVGDPTGLIFKQGASSLPAHIAVKRVGAEDWTRFDTSRGGAKPDGFTVVHSEKDPTRNGWYSDGSIADAARAEKQYAIEYMKSFLPTAISKS